MQNKESRLIEEHLNTVLSRGSRTIRVKDVTGCHSVTRLPLFQFNYEPRFIVMEENVANLIDKIMAWMTKINRDLFNVSPPL